MLFSISYVLLGLIAVIHAIPFYSGDIHSSVQTAPSRPRPPPRGGPSNPPPRGPSNPPPRGPSTSTSTSHNPHSQLPHPKDKIYIDFYLGKRIEGTGCSNPMFEKELTLIFEAYRQHINVGRPFEFSFLNEYDGDDIHKNQHHFAFWGEGVGEDCQTSLKSCEVEYDEESSSSSSSSSTRLAIILAESLAVEDTPVLFQVTYAIRNRVLSESNGRSTSLCKVM
ncbi:hypothetical protein DFH05DRAFT_1460458 [Lentinula detonsa]|uniref:Uncharacterized protein n=1 Tax=Lentinula detonsa TaxID=2804962 RepID=A0A9W8P0C4_9AGAR|nr:hypothetical protein DFH05DRAFT_1460458 [Lentinula detonsa]